MGKLFEDGTAFTGYDKLNVPLNGQDRQQLYKAYASFGWRLDESSEHDTGFLLLSREKSILNRAELTRLQRHFEACLHDIERLESSKTEQAGILTMEISIASGTLFAIGIMTAAYDLPLLLPAWLFIAVGAAGLCVGLVAYRVLSRRNTTASDALIRQKQAEIQEICKTASELLH